MAKSEEDIVRKIAALMEKAERTESAEEAQTFRDHAHKLMESYKVESWKLDEARAAKGESRVSKIVTMDFYSTSEFREAFLLMLAHLADAMGMKSALWKEWGFSDGLPQMRVQIVGYEVDLHYLSMLYANLMMEAASTLEARPDPNRSFNENIWRLHESAVQWERIRIMMNEDFDRGNYIADGGWRRIPGAYATIDSISGKKIPGASDGGVMRNAARAHCERVGIEYHSIVNGKRYRKSYVIAFTERIEQRYNEMMRYEASGSNALVLFDRTKLVTDKFKELHPRLGNYKDTRMTGHRMLDVAADRGREAANKQNLSRNSNVGAADRTSAGQIGR